ncbi:hypothetical protein V3C99_006133 [Haemonchus contortus]
MADVEMEQPKAEPKEEVVETNGNADKIQEAQGISKYAEDEVFKKLLSQQMKQSVAESMMKLFESGFMAIEDFDERAVEMMNSFPEDQARYIVDQLRESRLYGVQNKPQYLMSLMRNFRDRIRAQGAQAVFRDRIQAQGD